jgi:hypothetical protein
MVGGSIQDGSLERERTREKKEGGKQRKGGFSGGLSTRGRPSWGERGCVCVCVCVCAYLRIRAPNRNLISSSET